MESYYDLEQALRSMTNIELKRFERFLHSIYFIKNHTRYKAVCKFFNALKGYLNKSSFSVDDYFHAVQSACPDIIEKDKSYRKTLAQLKSDLHSYWRDFIAIESFQKNRAYYYLSILNELENRKLTDEFEHICEVKRFNNVVKNCMEPYYSYCFWKMCHIANVHKERNKNSCLCFSSKPVQKLHNEDKDIWEQEPDYNTEQMALMDFIKCEDSILSQKFKNNGGWG